MGSRVSFVCWVEWREEARGWKFVGDDGCNVNVKIRLFATPTTPPESLAFICLYAIDF